jgi:crotonobetainyl-CoA:carnitine CoA-transferase CaiB-like acyl-CoA transferase
VEIADSIAGPYAGRLFSDLGAEVVKLEPPGGDSSRCHGPFPDQRRSPEESGLFQVLNAGKIGLVLDPARKSARDAFEGLAAEADAVLVGAGSPLERLVQGSLTDLQARHPRLVVGYVGSVGSQVDSAQSIEGSMRSGAVAGANDLIGEHDRPPLVMPYDLFNYLTGATLCAAITTALCVRDRQGRGQVVEIYEDEQIIYNDFAVSFLIPAGVAFKRDGRRLAGSGGPYPFGVFPCKDGQVALVGRTKENLQSLRTMLGDPDWGYDPRLQDPIEVALHHADEVDALMIPLLRKHTRAELLEFGAQHAFAVGPLLTIPEVLDHEHFRIRGLWSDELSVGNHRVRYAKSPALFSRTPQHSVTHPAPTLTSAVKATNVSVFTEPRSAWLPDAASSSESVVAPNAWALAGIRVIDFSWAFAGPMVASTLADLGADVIKVEHRGRLDNARLRARPVRDGKPLDGPIEEVSLYFHQNNRGKRSVGIDMKHPAGRELVRDLMRSADIVVENLSTGVFERAGLSYKEIACDNPRLVWLSLGAAGRTGPMANSRGYAPIMTSIAGLEGLVGYEGEEPIGALATAFGDINGAAHGLVAVLAALSYAQRRGLGQYIDVSQIDATVAALCEPITEYLVTGKTPQPQATVHPRFVPHGNYPCEGDDRWVTIWVVNDNEWAALVKCCGTAGSLADLGASADLDTRKAHRLEIDAALGAWTRDRSREEAVATLANAGVRAAPLRSAAEADADWVATKPTTKVEHPVTGRERVFTVPWRFSATPPRTVRPAPMVGQHTEQALMEILGLDDETIEKLLADEAIEGPVERW